MSTARRRGRAATTPTLPPPVTQWLGRLVRLPHIPDMFDVALATVKLWRYNHNRFVGTDDAPTHNMLPPPIVLPPELRNIVTEAVWDVEVLTEWGRQTGRLDQANKPVKLLPPGRPRGPRE
jgi:hypothetical protein